MNTGRTRLEERYRRVLRMLPTSYRLRWEEEMVEAFLASVETDDPERAEFLAEFGRPSLSEVASVAALSLRLRLGLAGTPTPRSSAWGGAWRIVALAWLLAGAAQVTAFVTAQLWAPSLVDWMGAPEDGSVVVETAPIPWIWQYTPLLWVVAFLALLLGRLRVARVVAVLLVAHSLLWLVVSVGADLFGDGSPLWGYDVPLVVLDLCLLPALWAFTPGRPVVPRRWPWLLAYAGAVVLVSVHLTVVLTEVVDWTAVDALGLSTVGVVTAAVVHLARRRHDPAWSLGLAILIGIVLAQRLVTLPWAANADQVGAAVGVAAAEIAALMLTAIPLIAVGARGLARLRTGQMPAAPA